MTAPRSSIEPPKCQQYQCVSRYVESKCCVVCRRGIVNVCCMCLRPVGCRLYRLWCGKNITQQATGTDLQQGLVLEQGLDLKLAAQSDCIFLEEGKTVKVAYNSVWHGDVCLRFPGEPD